VQVLVPHIKQFLMLLPQQLIVSMLDDVYPIAWGRIPDAKWPPERGTFSDTTHEELPGHGMQCNQAPEEW
jgi:hypothetical protein